MPYTIELPDGTQIADVPDEIDPDTAVTNVGRSDAKVAKFAPQTNLYSLEGLKATGVAGAQGVMQAGLGMVGSDIEQFSTPPETSVPFFEGIQRGLGIREPALDAIVGAVPTPAERSLAEARGKVQEAATQLLPVNPSEPLRQAMGVEQSVAMNLPGFAASVLTKSPIPALVGAGATTKWQSQEQAREAGASPEAAAMSGGLQAIPEVGLELWPVARFLKEVGVDSLLKSVAKFVGREEATELGTTASQEVIQWAVENPNMSVKDFAAKAGQSLLDTAVQTPFSAGLLGGAGAMIAPVMGRNTSTEPPAVTPPTQPYQPDVPALLQPVAPVPPTEGVTKAEVPPEPLRNVGPQEVDLEAGQAMLDAIGEGVELPSTPPARPVAPQTVGLAAELDSVDESAEWGQSPKSAANDINYPNPNDAIPRSQRIILVGPREVVGKRFGEVDWSGVKPTTIVLGDESTDRPLMFLKPVRGVLEALRSTFTPNSGLIVSNESIRNPTGLGWHTRLSSGASLIVPSPVRKLGEVGTDKFNPVTLAKAYYNLFHEFGHMLTEQRFVEKLAPELQTQFLSRMNGLEIPPSLVAQLEAVDPKAAAVVRDWKRMVGRVLDGSMTAEQFANEWWGPAKLRHGTLMQVLGIAPNAPATDLLKAIARESIRFDKTGEMDQMTVADAQGRIMRRYLSLHEYMAEQLARHAHAKGADTASGFFREAVAGLRNYFRELKKGIYDAEGNEYKVEAGTSFQEWIDGMGGMDKALRKIAKSEGRVAKVTKGAKAKAPTPKTEPAKPQAPPSDLTGVQKALLGMLELYPSGDTTTKAEGLIRLGRTQEAQELLADAREGRIQWELDEGGDEVTKRFMEGARFRDEYLKAQDEFKARLMRDPQGPIPQESFDTENPGRMLGFLEAEEPYIAKALNRAKMRKEYPNEAGSFIFESQDVGPDGELYSALNWAASLEENRWLQELIRTGREHNQFLSPFAGQYAEDASSQRAKYFFNLAEKYDLLDEYHEMFFFRPLKQLVARREEMDKVKAEGGWLRSGRIHWEIDPIDDLLERGLTEAEAKDPKVRTAAAKEWYAQGTKSRFFKAWFGDWEQGRENPYIRSDSSQVLTADKMPLIVFHVTKSMHEVFDRGDVGFHFGTAGAAENRFRDLTTGTPEEAPNEEPWHTLPAFLNLRNPLDVGQETMDMWNSPLELAAVAHFKGELSREEVEDVRLWDMNWLGQHPDSWGPKMLYERFSYLRGMLASKGYDGIKYDNTVEGGTSWVAFYPDQVKSATGRNHTFSRSRSMQWETDFDLSTEGGQQAASLLKRLERFGLNNSWLRGALRWQMRFATDAFQGQQLAHLHPDVIPLLNMQINGDRYIQSRSRLFVGPVDMLNWLRWKGKENSAKMWKTILREVAGGTHTLTEITGNPGRWEQHPTPKLREELLASGIRADQVDDVALRVLQVKQSMIDILNYAAQVMAGRYIAKFASTMDPARLMQTVQQQVYDVLTLYKNTPFLPETSFGDAAVVIEERNAKGQWVPIVRRFFESDRKMEQFLIKEDTKNKLRNNPNLRVIPVTKIEKRVGVLVNLPKEFVDDVAEQLSLTVGERNQLEQLMTPTKMDRVQQMFGKRILGGTNDYARNYADFTWHAVNALAKMEYAGKFTKDIRDMRGMVDLAREIQDPYVRIMEERRLSTIENWMHKTKEFILNPPNEHQRLRSSIALTYLWMMPKTALMNFFGLMTTMGHLTAKYGPIEGGKRFTQAVIEAWGSAYPSLAGKPVGPEIEALMARAISDGLISESYAYHVAAIATEGTLGRLPGQSTWELFKERGLDVGLFLFRTGEHGTRRVALAAAWREGIDEGMNADEAYQYAYRQTKLQQNSFNPFDRPAWMRGEYIAPATVFYGFSQHMLFHSLGGYELGMRRKAILQGKTPRSIWGGYTMQMWAMLILLAGYEGLPGAEDLLNLLDPIFRRKFGKSARQYIRENMKWFEELTGADSATLAHGLANDVGGVSVSRSIGLGKMVPGSDFFKEGATANESFANLVFGALGPLGGMVSWGWRSAFSDRDMLDKAGSFPGAIGAWSTAASWALNGAKDPVGASLLVDEKGKAIDPSAGAIIMRGMGFQNTDIANARERRFAQQEGKMYWAERRARLLRDRATAAVERDREAIADASAAIREFNSELPPGWRAMAIRPEQIRSSIKSRMAEIRSREREVPRQKTYRGVYQEIGEAYK